MPTVRHFTLVLCTTAASATAEEFTAVEPLLKAHIAARGGQQRLDAIRTITIEGTRKMGPVEAPFTRVWKRPDKVRLDFSFQGVTGTQAHDGTTAWMIMPFMGHTAPEVMPPDMRASLRDQFDALGPLINHEKKGHRIEWGGRQTLDEADVYVLKVTRREGTTAAYYLATDSLLVVRTVSVHNVRGLDVELTMTYGEYRTVDGLAWPHVLAVRGGPQGGDIIVRSVVFNAEIPDERFAMPHKVEAAPPAGD